jgi:hypothetical protein
MLSQAKYLIDNIICSDHELFNSDKPAVLVSTFDRPEDFLVIAYLFRNKDLTFLSVRNLPDNSILDRLKRVSNVLYFEGKNLQYSFLRHLYSILRDYNRSVVLSADAAKIYAQGQSIDPNFILRIARKAAVPIIPVRITWKNVARNGKMRQTETCDVYIDDEVNVSEGKLKVKDSPTENYQNLFYVFSERNQ